ncbi:MAG TPA: UDP-3-O-acyl-N-acetylglucosamine deacetylase [Nitrospiria bacterium]
MHLQRTIKKIVHCSGIGLHSGGRVTLRLVPAPIDTGIVFLRKTAKGPIPVKVDGTKVVATLLSTTIGENGAKIQTVEHLLAALSGLQITNLIIELDSSELPIMDGSAKPFVDLLLAAGILEQGALQPVLKITRPVEVREGEKWITIRPSSTFSVNCSIQFDHPLLSHQSYRYEASPEEFIHWIAPARTFGFLNEVEALRSQGLARGGSLENAVVIGDRGVLNQEGLRYSDEFVRHKVLDMLGDLSLLGMPILGEVEAHCTGHQLNTKLVSTILSSTDSWTILKDRPSAAQTKSPADSRITAQVS